MCGWTAEVSPLIGEHESKPWRVFISAVAVGRMSLPGTMVEASPKAGLCGVLYAPKPISHKNGQQKPALCVFRMRAREKINE